MSFLNIPKGPGHPEVVEVIIDFGPEPVRIECPICRSTIFTETKATTSAVGWLVGLLLCVVG